MQTGLARPRRFKRLAAAAILLAMLPAAASAQQQNYQSPEQASLNPPKKPVTVKKRPADVPGLSSYWSNSYETPIQGGVQRRQDDVKFRDITSRTPLQDGSGGSIGFASTRSSAATLYDGSAVPGIDPNTRSNSSGAGLSLSVPTSDNALLAPARILGGPPTW